jgi:hypothetical protein
MVRRIEVHDAGREPDRPVWIPLFNESLSRQRAPSELEQANILRRAVRCLRFYDDMKRFRCDGARTSGICRHVYLGDPSELADVAQRLNDLVASEPLVLLDLALWKKASCELHPPGSSVTTPLEWKIWLNQGWKAKKPTSRNDPRIGTVPRPEEGRR